MKVEKTLKQSLARIPKQPGVYKFLNSAGDVLYVGKATDLYSRVNSYFSNEHQDRPHIIRMLPKVKDVEVLTTTNDVEALILEAALIKEYRPKFNILLKDDKSYAWILVTTKEEFPTVRVVRNVSKHELAQGKVFGPYPKGKAVRQIYRYIRRLYPFSTCKNTEKPCFYHHIGLCPCPRLGLISKEEYRAQINELIKFLQGKKVRHIANLQKEMRQLARQQRFEEAALLRDKIADLKHLGVSRNLTRDVKTETDFKRRKREILKKHLQSIANTIDAEANTKLNKDALLKKLSRIECYDISNTQGSLAYGSMVVAINGELNGKEYRVFRIKGMDTPNDYAMLQEVFTRRLSDKAFPRPKTILVDGGKTHLEALSEIIPQNVLLLGISKGRSRRKKGLRLRDEFWIREYSGKQPIISRIKFSDAQIFVTLRDEAHRFALKHHRNARRKAQAVSSLDKIEGIGPKRRKALLSAFGSVEKLKAASIEDIDKVIRNKQISQKVHAGLAE